MNKVKFQPAGYHTVTPYLIAKDASQTLDFYKKAFGAEEVYRMDHGGKLMHAEFQIGDSRLMLADEFPEMDARGPGHYGGSPVGLMIYVENVDKFVEHAVAAGAKMIRPVKDQFYGDRSGTVKDPAGFSWTISTHVEDVSPEEMQKRMSQFKG